MHIIDYKDTIHKLYYLTCVEASKCKERQKDDAYALGELDIEKIREEREKSELLQYLEEFDETTVKVVLAVMYIGRDYEITETEYRNAQDIPGNKDKEIDVNQIYSKRLALHKYFERAMRILGI